ncbi:MAG: ABC transporter permease [Muribaculaceae bacterium]|nr:ABC transporter permease [Muribaculaceae bacterium]
MIKQTLYNLKSEPVMGWLSVIGTSLCLLLVMMISIIGDLTEAAYSPESNRSRILYDNHIMLTDGNTWRGSGLGRLAVDRLYGNLPSAEMVSVCSAWFGTTDVETDGSDMSVADVRTTDANYWRIFDHPVRAGRTFSDEEVASGANVAILTEYMARKLFGGNEQAIGKTVRVSSKPYIVKGVVADVSPLMNMSYAQLWIVNDLPGSGGEEARINDFAGQYAAVILCPSAEAVETVKRQARSNLDAMNRELDAMGGWKRVEAEDVPFDVASLKAKEFGSDADGERRFWWILVAVFLIVPSINLSSMMRGRLERRRHEIGVRRAFGATRWEIFSELLSENFVMTLIGGAIGLGLCMLFAWLFAGNLIDQGWNHPMAEVSLPLGALFSWRIFLMALVVCFVLNLLSSGVPSLKAARVNPVEALNKRV